MKFCSNSVSLLLLCSISPSLVNAKEVVGKNNSRNLKAKKAKNTKKSKPESNVPNDPVYYPKDMPPPPEMWIEGFASRLHAQNIQKYETPIQVNSPLLTFHMPSFCWTTILSFSQ